tara:strand:- start:368 stop:601 length:234 start_codon:yes stop_codon:yes gene_type:complete
MGADDGRHNILIFTPNRFYYPQRVRERFGVGVQSAALNELCCDLDDSFRLWEILQLRILPGKGIGIDVLGVGKVHHS